jgi:hypothetical protein
MGKGALGLEKGGMHVPSISRMMEERGKRDGSLVDLISLKI